MRFNHLHLEYELPDAWWNEAGMCSFAADGRAYVADPSQLPDFPIFELALIDLLPLQRQGSHGVFNDNPAFGTAQERVINILRGFREKSALPPIKVARLPTTEAPRYKLIDGAHRTYCSLAAGYSHIPAIEVEDFLDTPNAP